MAKPLVPEDVAHEAEQRRRQEYIRRMRAELAGGKTLETREARFARRQKESYEPIAHQLTRLTPGASDISVLPRLSAHLLDEVDGLIAIAVDELRQELKGELQD